MRLEYSSPLVGWQTRSAGLLMTSSSASSWITSKSLFMGGWLRLAGHEIGARAGLSALTTGVSSRRVKEKSNVWLPVLLMIAFAATRWPGLLPLNFSAAYALVFCAGVYLPRRLAWWLPLMTMLGTDLLLNLHYHRLYEGNPGAYAAPMDFFNPYLLANYL